MMSLRATRLLYLTGVAFKSTKATVVKPVKSNTPELSVLPPAPNLRSLQFKGSKRGTIKPIFLREKIQPETRVDPTHPVIKDPSFRPIAASNEYFDVTVYPNAMLKRLGVDFTSSGKLRPRPPPEPDFPVINRGKRVKFASTFILAAKTIHKSSVVRTRLKRRLLETIRLVVTRGANMDPKTKKITFSEQEAGEAKWLLRDWYYVFHPKPAGYYALWPDLVRATRLTLGQLIERTTEWSTKWRLELAQREGAALDRLTHREMRRVRMWRQQDQEAAARGSIADDVGIGRKEGRFGVKKRRMSKPTRGARLSPISRKDSREIRSAANGLVEKRVPRSLQTGSTWPKSNHTLRDQHPDGRLKHDAHRSIPLSPSPKTATSSKPALSSPAHSSNPKDLGQQRYKSRQPKAGR